MANKFVLNIVELQNVVTNVSGTTPVQQLSNAVANIQKMVLYDSKTILANNLSNYNISPLQVQTSLNLASNATLTLNGTAITGGTAATSTIGNGPSVQHYYSTTIGTDPAITMTVGAPSVTPLVVLGSGQIQFPLAGTPAAGLYLTCMDSAGTAQWQPLPPPPSDARLKTLIRPIENAAEILEGLHGVRFKWKSNGAPDVGVIAQDVMKVLPEAVTIDQEGYYGVHYMKLIPVLLETVKDLRARVEALELEAQGNLPPV